MSWGTVISVGLKLILAFMNYINARTAMKAGEDKVIAEVSLKILGATQTGKRLRDRIKALGDDEADKLWDEMTNV